MRPRGYQPTRSTVELFIEAERLSWVWKWVATALVLSLGIGFMIFPFATGHVSDQQKVDKTRLGLMSGVLVTLGCIGLVVVCFAVRNWIFQLHFAARPAAFVCAMGIANILLVVYRTGQARHAGGPGALSLAIIILTFTLTTLWIVYAVILHHKIRAARHRDEARRQRSSTTLHSTHSHPQHHPSAYSDDELLRQQLSQLLQRSAERETPATGFWRSLWPWSSRSKTTSHMPLSDSQIDLVRSTFHIDMPSPSSGATAEHYRRQSHPNINPAATRPYSPDQRRYRNPFLDPDSARAAASVRSSQSGPPGETHELHSPQHANPNTGPSAYLPISQAENFSPPPTSNQFKQTYYHSPSSPQPAEIHEAPPQFHARNGWGRSTSPPPTTTRKTIRNEPSQRELRRAEIELGIVGPGPMLGGLRRA